jgi:anionic cell wall polymer biosynthesis LytR-Cps2A-Psr (LCP) family protein
MTDRKPSLDGFVPRRPGSQLGGQNFNVPKRSEVPQGLAPATPVDKETPPIITRSQLGIARSDIDESLQGIDAPVETKRGKKRRAKGPVNKKRRIIKWAAILIVVAVLAVGGWLAYKTLSAGGNVFKGSLLGLVQNKPLKQDENGRSNILVLGTSEDDPGHQGANLTDSIMILSIDQKNKNAYMISIPRDLEVKYGEACLSGYQGKINVYFSCVGGGTNDTNATREALTKTANFVGGVVGLDIQYGINVNYTVMRELVSAVGGITVNIESRDPRGQMDANFDWKCGVGDWKVSNAERLRRCPPAGHFIDYPNGPANLDAEHALYLAQARGDAANYGFEQSNFDREKNQQKIVKAIREKALSVGVLTNIGKVSGVIDAFGNNLRTTFEADEVQTLISLAKDIKDQDIKSISLIDDDGNNPAVMNGNAQPVAGMYQFEGIQALIKRKLSSNPVTREEANIVVLNGSGVAGVAKTEADKLESQGFIISNMDNAPEGTYADVEVYQIGTDKPATKAKLESLFGVKAKTTPPPVAAEAGTNFVVVFGKARDAN